MDNQRQKFSSSVFILHSLPVALCVLFLIDALSSFFTARFPWALLITLPLKVYCLSGFAGCILEIISGEEFVTRFSRFNRNARQLWPGFLAASVIVLVTDLILFGLLPQLRSLRPAYFVLMSLVTACALSQWAVDRKYIGPFGLAYRSFKPDVNFLFVILTCGVLEVALVKVSGFHAGKISWRNIVFFLQNYIHVFEFIYFSMAVIDANPDIRRKFSSQREIFLINPMFSGIFQGMGFWAAKGYPPFFLVLKALTPKTYRFREFDQIVWRERYYRSNVLVCITCFTSNSYEAYKLAKEFKKRGAKVVMGGPHVSFFPNEALSFCDSVVMGAAEGIWKDVIRDYEAGTLQPQYRGPATDEDHAQVYQEILTSPPAIAREFLETSRGCKFRCHFCTIPANSEGKIRFQAISSFVELIKMIKTRQNDVTFIDNNIYSDPGYARELFTALKPLKIKWRSECSIDIGKNEQTIKLARESGCELLGIGYEIFGASAEKTQGGKFAMAQKFYEYSQNIKRQGIKIKGQFIYGFDTDNLKTLFQLWRFIFSIRPEVTALSVLTPLPGAGVYKDMLRDDRIISLNWRSYTCHKLVVRHPNLNPRLITFCYPFIQVLFFLTSSSLGLIITSAFLFNFSCVIIAHFFKF